MISVRQIKFRGQIAKGIRGAGYWQYWGVGGCDLLDVIDSDSIGQYTGLKDANGKEIYEGDLIKVIGAESGEMIVRVKDITAMDLSTLYPAGEIIGNIYENPELLEG